MIKIYTASFESTPMDMQGNLKKALEALSAAVKEHCDILVFPQGFLLGAPLGLLKDRQYIKDAYNKHMHKIYSGLWLSRMYILCDKMTDDGFESSFFYQGQDTGSLSCQIEQIKVSACQRPSDLFEDSEFLHKKADLFILNWSMPTVAGQMQLYEQALCTLANAQGVSFVLCLGGRGYTTHPYFYKPCFGVINKSERRIFKSYREAIAAPCVYSVEVTRSLFISKHHPVATEFSVAYNDNPLIPVDVDKSDYCLDLFDMQAASLAGRMHNIDCVSVVLNLSGGLDSCLALLVCVNTFDMLGLDKSGIHVVFMPCFGTADKTREIADELCKMLGLPMLTVDIQDVCRKALSDIGHDGTTPDVVFENVQARMRTLNGLNLANKYNALMVGTGDLSEEALGFATYGGDQMASYNVNCCVAKTVLREMLPAVCTLPLFSGVKSTIDKVLAVPVSPELLPTNGEVVQKTEEILAPYKLLDFFLYCMVVAKLAPEQWVEKALLVFNDEFSKEHIQEKATLFCKKFIAGQFKRSAAPEGASITHAGLWGMENFYPSDGSVAAFTDFL